ncbi:MAG TPA: serine/threonine-protein kinase [Planctomycetota bacterium]|nr:serine/threonine-protein kinase [Planctomycetota bacterium]
MQQDVDAALAEFVAAFEAGEDLDVESFCALRSPHDRELREMIGDYLTYVAPGRARAAPLAKAARETRVRREPPRELGDFVLRDEIGRGGMGVVYEAEQRSLRRTVALKVLAAHVTLRPDEVERFRREASTAARLRHPGIVEVHAVGEHEGTHYFAMERIEGRSLDRVLAELREKGAPPAEGDPFRGRGDGTYVAAVARIAASVADALDAAHRAGVIHRDVKPSNVLLRPDGAPVVTDFGLAREEGLGTLTASREFLGTPHYVAPEQATRRAVDHRADVWSLGATLYECLTLRRPFEAESAQAVLAKVLVTEPPAPSRWNPHVPADLDTIVAKALEKDPARRYATAAALASDLRAFLEHRPIAARPLSRPARATRWVRRNPLLATTALLAVLALVVAPLAIAWREHDARTKVEDALGAASEARDKLKVALGETEAARDDAKAALEDAEANLVLTQDAVERLLLRIAYDRLQDVPRAEGLRREILGDALETFEKLLAKSPRSPALRLGASQTLLFLGSQEVELGHEASALERYARARALSEEVLAEMPTDPRPRQVIAEIRDKVGTLRIQRLAYADAEPELRAALELWEGLLAETPDDAFRAAMVAGRRNNLAISLRGQGRGAEAIELLRQSCADLRALLTARPDDSKRREDLASTLLNLSDDARDLDPKSSEAALRESLDLLEHASAEASAMVEMRSSLAGALDRLGTLEKNAGRMEAAGEAFARSIVVSRALVRDFPRVPILRHQLALTLANLSEVVAADAEPGVTALYEEASTILEDLARAEPDQPSYRVGVASVHASAAVGFERTGDFAGATDALDAGVTVAEAMLRKFPGLDVALERVVMARADFAAFLERRGEIERAIEEARAGSEAAEEWVKAAASDESRGYSSSLARTLESLLAKRGEDAAAPASSPADR